uniref:AlNc14C246G9572 protein n=1 Tax=Albugo laibachii Nc14 TaxID=890382 RepID=F0WT87_9STRA|nr:AlNc14C246G9572 [Albugo laibachii Nc14]|eukprot:CCA24575.1 AlNc14C246G9572 [Albugo laibachii Nc14]
MTAHVVQHRIKRITRDQYLDASTQIAGLASLNTHIIIIFLRTGEAASFTRRHNLTISALARWLRTLVAIHLNCVEPIFISDSSDVASEGLRKTE